MRSRHIKHNQAGATAVEAAVCIALVLMPLLVFLLLFGRFFWYYDVATKAAHDAALYMATAPIGEMKGQGGPNLAVYIMERELSDIDADTAATFSLTANCGYKVSSNINYLNCNSSFTPQMVQAGVVMVVTDPFFAPLTNAIWGSNGVPIMATNQIPYIGR